MNYNKLFETHNAYANFTELKPGLYVVDGKTGIGKTTYATDLFHDLIRITQHTKGIYVSLNDNKDVITNHFIRNITDLTLDQIRHKQQWHKIEKAYKYLITQADADEIDILDHTDVETPEDVRKAITSTNNKNMFVIIDGMLDFETKGYRTIDAAYYAMVTKIKEMIKEFNIPFICTADVTDRYIYEKKADMLLAL